MNATELVQETRKKLRRIGDKEFRRMTQAEKAMLIIEFIADPNNKDISKAKIARHMGLHVRALNRAFSDEDWQAAINQAMAIRRAALYHKIALIDDSLIVEALAGNVQAIKLAYQRLEGWREGQEISGPGGKPLEQLPSKIIVQVVKPKEVEGDDGTQT